MKKKAGVVCTALLAMGLFVSPAMAADVTVTLPTFPVTLNGVTMEQSKSQYPMLVYKDITYVPMTWADTRLLGLESNWTEKNGLVIEKAETVLDAAAAKNNYQPYKASAENKSSYPAAKASGKITVNGKAITNSKEEYPLLLFRDVTYFPLTWRFAVNEFGWDYTFDQKNGLVITPKATATNGGTTAADDDIIGQKIVVSGSNVNLRSGAGTGNSSVGMVQKGTEFIVLDAKTADGKVWYEVMSSDGASKGWIASWLTQKSTESSVKPSTGSNDTVINSGQNGTITGQNGMVGKTVTVTASSVNLRADASTSSAVLGQTKKGDTYTVLAEKKSGTDCWYQVKMKNGAKAWIAGWLVQEATGSSSGNQNTVTENYDIVGKKVVVNANGVNLRKEPKTSAASVGTVNKGAEFIVLTVQTVDGQRWYQVKDAGGNKVWIASWLTDQAGSSSGAAAQTRLTLQSVQQQGSKTIVTLKHGKGNGYSVTKSSATELVLSLQNNYLTDGETIHKTYSSGPLRQLQVQSVGSNALKATLTLQKGAYCTVKESGDNLVITAYNQHADGEQGLRGKTIVLDPGHGGSDPGAVGKVLGVTDADVGLTVSQKLRDLLEAQGANVVMTRDTDIRVGLNDRPAMANRVEADLFVSVHGNSAENTSAKGIQVYYYAPSGNANLAAQSYIRKDLATAVSDGMQAATGTKSVVKTANYAVLRENDRPSILVETGFLSNAEEEALLASDAYRQKLANGIYQGILNYFNQY